MQLQQLDLSIGTNALAISPDGAHIVYTGPNADLLLRDLDRFDATPIPGTETGWSPCFSPDGDQLAFNTGFPGALRVVSLSGGTAVTLVADSTYGNGTAWSDDCWIYYVGSAGGHLGLMRIRASGGTPQLVAKPDPARDELFFMWPYILPGGRTALITRFEELQAKVGK